MGGGELARDYLTADLVDEIHLGVVPVLLGAGIPLFPGGFPQRDLSLVECKTYPNGLPHDRIQARPRKREAKILAATLSVLVGSSPSWPAPATLRAQHVR